MAGSAAFLRLAEATAGRSRLHSHCFTGCAGNITAESTTTARRNRASHSARPAGDGGRGTLRPEPARLAWRTESIRPSPNPRSVSVHSDGRPGLTRGRIRPAFKLASIRRHERQIPFVLGALQVNETVVLHLPAEPFVEYQLRAQALRPGRPVAVAAYGDGGPWYIPTRDEFPAGGYEVEHAFCDASAEDLLMGAITRLLA